MNALTNLAGNCFRWVLEASWQAAVLAALVLIAQLLFRNKLSPKWRYGLWMLVVVRLLMPGLPRSAISIFNLAKLPPVRTAAAPHRALALASMEGPRAETPGRLGSAAEAAPHPAAPRVRSPSRFSPAPASGTGSAFRAEVTPPVDWFAITCGIWFGGVCLLGLRLIWTNLRFRSCLTRRVAVSDTEVSRLVRGCAEMLGVNQPVVVIETEQVESPAVCGLWRRWLLLPDGIFDRFSRRELQHIFLHELAHIKRRDLEINWLTGILQILHWFNPVLWLAFARMRADRELATDALALARGRESEKAGYGETILKVLEGMVRKPVQPGLVGIAENKARMKERLLAIVNRNPARPWRWAAVGIAIVLAGVGLTGAQQGRDSGRKNAAGAAPVSQHDSSITDHNFHGSVERHFAIRVLDYDTGAPLSGAKVTFTLDSFSGEAGKHVVLTGQDGRAAIRFPASNLKRLGYRAVKTNYLTLHGEWSDQQLSQLGAEYQIKLARGVAIGGTVTDEEGRPVAGAEVSVDQPMGMILSSAAYHVDHAEIWSVSSGKRLATTDASGRWSAKCVWPGVRWASLRIHHPGYADTTCSTELTSAMEAAGWGVKVSFDDLVHDRVVLKLGKGVVVNGRVVDEAGNPLSGIRVSYAELLTAPHSSGRLLGLRKVTTDAAGQFRIDHAPLKHLFFLAQTAGYAPSVAELDPKPAGSEVELRLSKGLKLSGQVLDDQGNPVVGAQLSFPDFGMWRGIHWEAVSDAQGRFQWAHAPRQRFELKTEKNGFITGQQIVQVGSSEKVTVHLHRTLQITGKVLDANTKEPVSHFQIDWMDRGDPRDFDRGYQLATFPGSNGVYSIDLARLYATTWFEGYAHDCVFRVRADGYAPFVSRVFSSRNGDVGDVSYNLELKPAARLSGVVVDRNGRPVADAQVALAVRPSGSYGYHVPRLLLDGHPFFKSFEPGLYRVTDGQGRFHLNFDPETTGIIAVNEAGFARIEVSRPATNLIVRLEPWGGIDGTAWEYDRLVTNQSIWASAAFAPEVEPMRTEFRTNSDDRGRFAWNFVPPGKYRVYRMIPMPGGGTSGGPGRLVQVKPGRTARIKLGGEGRRVIGRFKIRNPYVAVDWRSDNNITYVSSVTPRPPASVKTAGEFRAWRRQPAIEHAFEIRRSYPIQFASNGSFHIDEMLPGEYQMYIQLLDPRDPDAMAYSEYIGQFSGTFEVPTNSPGSIKPLDVGVFEMSLKPQIVKGRTPAPQFEAVDMAGRKFKLSNFRGKYVLLDFWATWCGPCIGEFAYLKQAYEKFGSRSDFVIVSLNLDKDLRQPREFLQKNKLPWVQGYLGEKSGGTVSGEYGIQGIPAVFLINPQGNIIATDLADSSLVSPLEKYLK